MVRAAVVELASAWTSEVIVVQGESNGDLDKVCEGNRSWNERDQFKLSK